MTFEEILAHVIAVLQREGRIFIPGAPAPV